MNISRLSRWAQDLLQGKPLRHPLHPILVHAPIGLFILSLLLDMGSYLFGPDPALVQGALYSLGLALLAALVAALTGLADWADIREDHPARKFANLHLVLNLIVMGIYSASFVLRLLTPTAAVTPWTPLALSWLGVSLLSLSGYVGGRIVYEDGVAVGRHRRWGEVPRETLRVSSGATAGGAYVPVGVAADLLPGQTLRADVNGYVMAIANAGGEFHAFQDFCTHRYAPLSLGRVADGCVECPWHRSRFDVRTGAVKQGPATVALRTFPTRVSNGMIEVSVPAESPLRTPGRRVEGARSRAEGRPREAVGI